MATINQDLLQAHEELIAAARIFGLLVARRSTPLEDLEEAAGKLEETALSYARARRAVGPCEWLVGDAVMMQEDREINDFIQSSQGLYEAAEALLEMAELGQAAMEAARTILGRAALHFYEESRPVVAYTVTLRAAHHQ